MAGPSGFVLAVVAAAGSGGWGRGMAVMVMVMVLVHSGWFRMERRLRSDVLVMLVISRHAASVISSCWILVWDVVVLNRNRKSMCWWSGSPLAGLAGIGCMSMWTGSFRGGWM